jgi:hypothetical protein
MMTPIFFAALMLSSAPDTALGRELYDSLVQCAAFHGVEAGMTREGGDSAASHLAMANDYRADARKHTPDGQPASADAAVEKVTTLYGKMVREGDAKQMAADWTALESACRTLHAAKAQISGRADPGDSR